MEKVDLIAAEIVFNNIDGFDALPRDTLVVEVGGTTWLIIASGTGLHRFRIESDGSLTEIDVVSGNFYAIAEPIPQAGGSVLIHAYGNSDAVGFDGITSYTLGTDESFVAGPGVYDQPGLGPDDLLRSRADIELVEAFGETYIAVASQASEAIGLYDTKTLTQVSSIFDADDPSYKLYNANALASTTIDGSLYLIVSAAGDSAISFFEIGKDGALSKGAAVYEDFEDEGYRLLGVSDMELVTIGDKQFLITVSKSEDGMNVFEIDDTDFKNSLTLVDTLDDGDGVTLADAQNLETTVVDGVTYLIVSFSISSSPSSAVAGPGSRGVSVIALDETGQLSPVLEVVTDSEGGFGSGEPPVITEVGGVKYLTVAGAEGMTLFRLINNLIDETAMTVEVAENTTPVTAVPKLFDDDAVTYALGGADAGLFTIDTDGNLSFLNAPDYENPGDSDGDNVYEVEVTASEGSDSETKVLTVKVTNVSGPDIVGTKNKDKLNGTDEDETILGKNGKDKLNGFAGGDLLDGGKKKDKLTGGEDADQFRFSSKLKDKWADKIKDFEVGEDTILLDAGIFKKLDGVGALTADAFGKGKKAGDADERILHHEKSGGLYYDKDGKGGKDAVKFAKVDKGLDLSEGDFLIV